jgi:hypothetical protein
MGTQKSKENVDKKLKYMSVIFERADKKEVYHHLNLNHKVSDFIIAEDLDNNRIIGEIFTPLYTKVTTLTPRFLKLVSGNQGRVLVDDESLLVEDIMSTDPYYLVKGYRYKASNATLPTLNETNEIPTKKEIIDVIRETCGEVTRTMINIDPYDTRAEELERRISELERGIKARDVKIDRLADEFNNELRKKNNEIIKLKEEHNAEVVSMRLELGEKDVINEMLKEKIKVLKKPGVDTENED